MIKQMISLNIATVVTIAAVALSATGSIASAQGQPNLLRHKRRLSDRVTTSHSNAGSSNVSAILF